jgi:hypothetical protein
MNRGVAGMTREGAGNEKRSTVVNRGVAGMRRLPTSFLCHPLEIMVPPNKPHVFKQQEPYRFWAFCCA